MVVLFVLDEERNYRTVIALDHVEKSKVDIELLHAIAEAIEEVLK